MGAGREHEATASGRGRKGAEIEACDDGERAERADEKFVEVVAGYVFDDAAAAFAKATGAIYEFGTDQEIARGAIRMTKRGIDAGSDDAADGGFEIKRDGKREKLFLFVEGSGEVVEIGASIDADGEIAGIVVCDLVEAGRVEGNVVAGRWHADTEFGAVAAGDEGEFFESGKTDNFCDSLGGGWFGDGGGGDFVDGVLRADCGISNDLRRTDGGFEAGGEI